MSLYQLAGQKNLKRTDHVWVQVLGVTRFKCVLCGCVSLTEPPAYPTPKTWNGDWYEPLTDDERNLCPFKGK